MNKRSLEKPNFRLNKMSSNITAIDSLERRSPELNIFFATIMSLTAITAFVGNLATMIAVLTTQELLEQIPNFFIVFLALTDFVTSIGVMLPSIVAMIADEWVLGKRMCDFHQVMNYYCVINTTLLVALISIDRVFSIKYPLQYPSKVTRPRVLIAIAICTVIGLLGSLPATVILDNNSYEYFEVSCGMPFDAGQIAVAVYTSFNYTAFIVIPQIAIVVSTVIIVRSAKESNKNMQSMASQKEQNEAQEKKLVKSLLILIVAYALTIGAWASVKMFMVVFPNVTIRPRWFVALITCFLFIGSAVNPFIYAILRKDFRNAFKRLFVGLKNRVQPF